MDSSPLPPYVPLPGDLPVVFGRYRILGKLGHGGMASVYLAEDPNLHRRVALKVPILKEPHILDRFRQEARAAAQLQHPNLCTIYEAGEVEGTPYLTMHYVEGKPLSDIREEYSRSPRRVIALIETLARALAVVHQAGVIHRDLKPSNILIDGKSAPVIVDFGLAVHLDDDSRLTQIGQAMGTPSYMAPEQHQGDLNAIGPKCDLYSLGVILYELLTGKRPFLGKREDLLRLKNAGVFELPGRARPGLDPRLDPLCRRLLEPDPAKRPNGMAELARELAQLLDDSPTEALPVPEGPVLASGPTMHPSDPQVADEILEELRTWGWEATLGRLDERARLAETPRKRALMRLMAGYLRAQLGFHDQAVEYYRDAAQLPELQAWAAAGEGFIAYRRNELSRALQLLDEAEAGDPRDQALTATCEHLRGTIFYKQARDQQALEHLFHAAELYTPGHLGFARVLDTLGMVYATRGDYWLALAFYQRSLKEKENGNDRAGMALTHGQLGRLFLDWGDLNRARQAFLENLSLSQKINDVQGEAKMHNHLGQIEIERGQAARALAWLDESVKRSEIGKWAVPEAYARKDRARALVALRRFADAEADVRKADALFQERDFAEGTFHVRRVLAQILAAQGKRSESERLLVDAATHFSESAEHAEAARTWLELAHLQRQGGVVDSLVTQTLRQGLDAAERSGRDHLTSALERLLEEVDRAELYERRYRRARGCGIREDVNFVNDAHQETATVLFLDLQDSCRLTQESDPQIVRRMLNQIWTDLEPVLTKHGLVVNQYLGDGFMAFAREEGHALRATQAGLDLLAAVQAFNRPRNLLGMKTIKIRIGVCTGSVLFANVGTFRKIDFTAVGETTNRAARLQANAEDDAVCVSETTWKGTVGVFVARIPEGRAVSLKGYEPTRVWDVIGRKSASGPSTP